MDPADNSTAGVPPAVCSQQIAESQEIRLGGLARFQPGFDHCVSLRAARAGGFGDDDAGLAVERVGGDPWLRKGAILSGDVSPLITTMIARESDAAKKNLPDVRFLLDMPIGMRYNLDMVKDNRQGANEMNKNKQDYCFCRVALTVDQLVSALRTDLASMARIRMQSISAQTNNRLAACAHRTYQDLCASQFVAERSSFLDF